MFSVIIPLYNKEAYITKTVQSVLTQTFSEFELIIVNDGSTDNSLSIAKTINDKRIKVIDQKNFGVSIARNNGVSVSTYDNIAFLDADDWWDKNFLLEMSCILNDFPEAGIYGSKYYWMKNGKRQLSINHKGADFRGYIDYFEAYTYSLWMPLTSISTVIKKNVFNDLKGFKSNLKFGEDFDFWVRAALKYKIAYVNKPLAYYNQDISSKNKVVGTNRLFNKEAHYIFNLDYLNESEKEFPLLKKLLDRLRVQDLVNYYLKNKYSNEVNNILKKIDFKEHSIYYWMIYKMPKVLVRIFLKARWLGSQVKGRIVKISSN